MQFTKAEERVMLILWEIGEGVVSDILYPFNDPKPAHNTVSTVVRTLEKKGFVAHKAYGHVYLYYPLISKSEYSKNQLLGLMERYFDNSLLSIVSFLVHEKDLSPEELGKLFEDTKRIINKNTSTIM
jgi:BlaI family transcriptional regulator, penicillinase repressor